jgi:hypothetical protein
VCLIGYASLKWELFSHLDSYEYSHKYIFIILAKQDKEKWGNKFTLSNFSNNEAALQKLNE